MVRVGVWNVSLEGLQFSYTSPLFIYTPPTHLLGTDARRGTYSLSWVSNHQEHQPKVFNPKQGQWGIRGPQMEIKVRYRNYSRCFYVEILSRIHFYFLEVEPSRSSTWILRCCEVVIINEAHGVISTSQAFIRINFAEKSKFHFSCLKAMYCNNTNIKNPGLRYS